MADRFDKFTARARNVLTLAQDEAQRFNHNYLGTEHLLLGLMRESEGVACRMLTNLGVQLDDVVSEVEFLIGRGASAIPSQIGLTPRAKNVIELAVEEARLLQHSYIGTAHLLLGLVRQNDGVAFRVLQALGVSLDQLREETGRVLADMPEPDPAVKTSSEVEEIPRPAIAPPPIEETKRVSARAALEGALDRIVDVPADLPERDLLEALLRPMLLTLIDDLDSVSNDSPRGFAARHRVERVLPALASTATVAIRRGHAGLGDALTRAMVSVMDVLAP